MQLELLQKMQPWHKWLIVYLLSLPGVGRRTVFAVLLDILKNQIKPDEFWEWGSENQKYKNVFKNNDLKIQISYIEHFYASLCSELKKEFVSVMIIGSSEYPQQLYSCDDPPLVMYVQGNTQLFSKDAVAVVGSRKMTGYGQVVTKTITRQLVADDFCIISGCMYGVDECAHQEALSWGGSTIAVLGYGFRHAYPARMQFLRRNILEQNGLVVSEYPPQTLPRPGFFVERNRIIAGLSQAVVVTEAAQQSGSHSTAICAAENGRAVFAVPGAITNPYSEGTKWLINQGATLITSGYEVSEALGRTARRHDEVGAISLPESESIGRLDSKMRAVLQQGPLSAEAIARGIGVSIKDVLIMASQMEIRGELVKDGILWYLKQ